MSKKHEKLTKEFDAESANGQRFHILVYQSMIDAGHMSDPDAVIEGLKTVRTNDGYHCNFIDDDNLEIVELGLTVKRVNEPIERD